MEQLKNGIIISELLSRSFFGELDDIGQQRLDDLLKDIPDSDAIISEALDISAIQDKAEEYGKYDPDKSWDALRRNIKSSGRRRTISLRTVARYAAAVLIPAMVVGGIYLSQRRPGDIVAEQPVVAAYDPEKPHIILPSGEVVNLDGDQQYSRHKLGRHGISADNDAAIDYAHNNPSFQTPAYHTVIVPHGRDLKLRLSDGTDVWLFAESELTYPNVFTDSVRSVELKGEAFFDVADAGGRQFIVSAGHCDVEVLGTAFNVLAYPDSEVTETTLVRGSVRVADRILVPGQQLSLNNTTGETTIREVTTSNYLLRTRNMFVFENMNMHQIMEELARWYDFTPIFSHPEVAGKKFGLKINKGEDFEFVLRVLEMTGEVRFRMEGDTVYVENI